MKIVRNLGTERVIPADGASESGRRAAEAGHHELVRRSRNNGGKAASKIERGDPAETIAHIGKGES